MKNITFKIEITDKEEIETFYSILAWDQAEERLFSPHTLTKIENLNFHSTLIEITSQSMMEMSLLQRLNAKHYEKSLDEIEKFLKMFLKEHKISEATWKHGIK